MLTPEIYLFAALLILMLLMLYLQLRGRSGEIPVELRSRLDLFEKNHDRLETVVREEAKSNRQELTGILSGFQSALLEALNTISKTQLDQLKTITDANQQLLTGLNKTLEDKINALITKTEEINKSGREELNRSLKDFQASFDKNVESFNTVQREKFGQLEIKQNELIHQTEKKLEQMRETVDEKLQKTLNERLGHSFELVSRQLESVQKGLGEMQNLAQDVGGLKKVLSNVKMRGGLGEIRLEMLLEQILAPEQYEANVKTKKGSPDVVEFAIKLPGKDDEMGTVYLPIDAKFPQETYHQLTDAYESGDADAVETATRNLETAIRKMARDIQYKYLDPPNTTEFGIMFLPFEGVFAEVVRHSELIEQLQREFRVIVTGPTTLAAILNSLQMGFKTLAIQKRSSEVWKVLGAIKTEFGKFGGMLEKAQKNLHTATNQLDELVGKRTKAIQRRLRDVESLPQGEAAAYLPEIGENEAGEEQHEDA
jgi:DNA recombination protein RmuC